VSGDPSGPRCLRFRTTHGLSHLQVGWRLPGGTCDPAIFPDVFQSNASGYRVGWQDSLGIVAKSIVDPNLDIWSAPF